MAKCHLFTTLQSSPFFNFPFIHVFVLLFCPTFKNESLSRSASSFLGILYFLSNDLDNENLKKNQEKKNVTRAIYLFFPFLFIHRLGIKKI
ncbi:unnamed protein product [Meloidogyne enterolobii]|uniref:Uncharacterized protein n=1 Tax=Meloidogyne enterolobii TaxID=390850 RepID=A0ACB1AW77_MELEN